MGKPEGKNHLEDPGLDGRLILKKDLKQRGWEGINWIDQDQGRDTWTAVVNMAMNRQVP